MRRGSQTSQRRIATYNKKAISIEKSVSHPRATRTYIQYTSAHVHTCTRVDRYNSVAIAVFVDVRARDCQESQEESGNEKRAWLGSYVRHVWVLDYIYIPTPLPYPTEPRGPMRQYVPIIFPPRTLSLTRSLARSRSSSTIVYR